MAKGDADLFADWAADEFVAAGRARESDRRRRHRLQAELFCDIFHALNQAEANLPPAQPRLLIGSLLERAYEQRPETNQQS